MEWLLNFLVKLLGGFITSVGLLSLFALEKAGLILTIASLTVGLAILFSPKIPLEERRSFY